MPETKKNWTTIKCPFCSHEYIPAEIFLPGDFLGKPDSLVKDALGRILYCDYEEGEEPLATESFICEQCGKPFVVEPVISYKVKKEDEEKDFSTDTVSLLD